MFLEFLAILANGEFELDVGRHLVERILLDEHELMKKVCIGVRSNPVSKHLSRVFVLRESSVFE